MSRRTPLTIALVLCAALALAAGALAVSQTARAGQVAATFSYSVKKHKLLLPTYSHETLTITRAGHVAYGARVTGCVGCSPAGLEHDSVRVLDIDNTGEPNVILGLYTGGAHCCWVAQVFSYDAATQTYVEGRRNFGDPSYALKRLSPGGPYRFVSADDHFAYAFTSFAGSGLPLQIFSYQSNGFIDVTRSYPALIVKDAALWLRLFKHNLKNGTGPLAAWAADEELLGKDKLVQSALKAQLKAGHLVGGFVNGKRYIRQLNKLLHELGYER
jgi:hypothetical protein